MEAKEFQDRFIDAFIHVIRDDKYDLAEEYIDRICDVSVCVWNTHEQGNEAVYSLKRLQENCRRIFNECVKASSSMAKLICLKLIYKIYETLYICIITATNNAKDDSNKENGKESNKVNKSNKSNKSNKVNRGNRCDTRFQILDWTNVHNFLIRILQEIDIKTIQQNKIDIAALLLNMQIVDLTLTRETTISSSTTDTTIDIVWTPDYAITYIQFFMGWYLVKQLQNPTLLNISADADYKNFVNEFIIPTTLFVPASGVITSRVVNNGAKIKEYSKTASPETAALLVRELNVGNAIYVCGLIKEGLYSEVKTVFQPKDFFDNTYYSGNMTEDGRVIFTLLPFCYLYYIGFWEEEQFIKRADVRSVAQHLAKELSGQYKELLQRESVIEFLINDLRQSKLKLLIKKFAYREGTNELIAEDIVRDFCLFSVLYSEMYLKSTYWLLNKLPDDNDTPVAFSTSNTSNTDEAEKRDLFWLKWDKDSCLTYVKTGNDTEQKILHFLDFIGVKDQSVGNHTSSINSDDQRKKVKRAQIEPKQIAREMFDKLDRKIKSNVKEVQFGFDTAIEDKFRDAFQSVNTASRAASDATNMTTNMNSEVGNTRTTSTTSTTSTVGNKTAHYKITVCSDSSYGKLDANEKILYNVSVSRYDDDDANGLDDASSHTPKSGPDSTGGSTPELAPTDGKAGQTPMHGTPDMPNTPDAAVNFNSGESRTEKHFKDKHTISLEKKICRLIEKNFGVDNISIDASDAIAYKSAEIMCTIVYTKDLMNHLKNDIDFMVHTAYINLLDDYIQELVWREKLQHIDNYIKFFGPKTGTNYERLKAADAEYIKYLEKQGFNLMLGSRYFLSNRDINTSYKFDEKTKGYKWIVADGAFLGAAMKLGDVHFYIRKINAYVVPATIQDLNHKIQRTDSGIYEYEATEGIMIPFKVEDELREYIAKEKKVIRVEAEISVRIDKPEPKGIYFTKW